MATSVGTSMDGNERKVKILSFVLLLTAGITAGLLLATIFDQVNHSPVKDPLGQTVAEITQHRDENQKEGSQIYANKPLMNYSEKDEIHNILKKNVSGKWSTLGGKTYHIESNSKGLREEKFNKTLPEDTYRILVVGDSFTFGWGLNASDRYTEILEKRLNRNATQKYQVINAAIPGWGLKDYYKFIKYRGQNYNPDMIVAGLVGNEYISHAQHTIIQKKAEEEIKEEYNESELSQIKYNNLVADLMIDKLIAYREKKSKKESDTYIYSHKIQNISQRNDIPLVFYELGRIWHKSQEIMKTTDPNYLEIPERIRENPEKYRFEEDTHYNAKAQPLLADKLYHHLRNNYSIPN